MRNRNLNFQVSCPFIHCFKITHWYSNISIALIDMFYPIHCRPFPIHNLNKSEIRYTKILSFCVKLVQTSLANVRWLNTFIPNLCIISTLFDTIYHKIKCLLSQNPPQFYLGKLSRLQSEDLRLHTAPHTPRVSSYCHKLFSHFFAKIAERR